MTSQNITVSELVRCSICPMQHYLDRSEHAAFDEPYTYSIAKQIAAHLGSPLILEELWDELTAVRPEAGPGERQKLSSMIETCSKTGWRTALRNDVLVSSEKYGVNGRVDRLFDDSFAVVKSSAAPRSGIYAADRLRITAYAFCLEEEFHQPFAGTIEYLGSGTIRHIASPSPADRRAFLAALHTAENIRQGTVPKPLRGHHCLSCKHHERCRDTELPRSLFDKLYRRY